MGLADDLEGERDRMVSMPASRCYVSALFEALDERDRGALEEIFEDPRYVGTKIVEFLNNYGKRMSSEIKEPTKRELLIMEICRGIGSTTVQRHRRGECRCSKEAI